MVTVQDKVARAEIRAREREVTLRALVCLASNPVVELVLGVAAIEWLERQKIVGNIIATTTEAALFGAVAAQQMAPLAPYMSETLKSLVPAAGLLGRVKV